MSDAPPRTGRPSRREVLGLALPALGALAAEPLYVLADTAIVGHLGTEELAGLGIASTILLTSYTVFIFLAYGTTGAVARRTGAGDPRGAAGLAVQGIWLASGLAVVAMIVLAVAAPALVALLGGTGEVADHALVYLRISLLGLPALFVTMAGTGYLRGVADARTPLIVAVSTSVVNVVLQLALIEGLGWGIGASALSTVVAQTGGAGVYLAKVLGAARHLRASLRPDPALLRTLGGIGRDLVIRTASLRLAFGAATAVAARLGVVPLAGHQVAFEVWTFLALVLDAVAIAGQTIVGTRLGAEDSDGAVAAGWTIVRWGVAQGAVGAVLLGALRGPIAGLFSDDPAVVATAAELLGWVAVLLPLAGVVFALDGVLIGAGDLRFMAWAMAVVSVGFVGLALLVLHADAGIAWLWAAIGALMVGRAIPLLVRFASLRWVVLGADHPR